MSGLYELNKSGYRTMIDSTGNVSKSSAISTAKVSRTQEIDAKEQPAPAGATRQSDAVSITAQSEEMLAASQLSKGLEGVDLEKIERIKAALNEGNYPLDSERTAKNMIELEGLLSDIGKN